MWHRSRSPTTCACYLRIVLTRAVRPPRSQLLNPSMRRSNTMKRYTLLFCGAALAAIGSGAFAGEAFTERWHGVAPAFWEVEGGLRRFAAREPDQPNPRA